MRRSDQISPFDHETQTRSDLTQEFWGPSAGWNSNPERASRRLPTVDDTGSLRAIRDGVAAFRPRRVELRDQTGEVRRTRSHGVQPHVAHDPAPTSTSARSEASIGDLAAGHYDDAAPWSADDIGSPSEVQLTPAVPVAERLGLGGVDPLLLRLGALLLVGVLLVPIALALRSSSDEPGTVEIETPSEPLGDAAGAAPAVDGTTGADDERIDDGISGSAVEPQTTATNDGAAAPSAAGEPAAASTNEFSASSESVFAGDAGAASDESVGAVPESVDPAIAEPATVEAPAERVVPECPQTYEANPGDSWYRIADAADVSPSALMVENRATTDTAILPGDDICLPSGATMPKPPSTTTPATSSDSTSSDTGSTETAPATTAAPTTTEPAAATPSGSPGRDASVDEVKDVIRSVFPESEWDTAFTIAQRESRFEPTAYNGWCCHGVFQIYWSVHRSWLDDFGIDSSDDLYDPLLNVQAAYAIWQRSGNSWSAWSTYDG